MNNIEGITVLNSYTNYAFNVGAICVAIFLFLVSSALGIWLLFNQESGLGYFCIVISSIFIATLSLLLVFNKDVLHEDVLISDSVSFNEIYDKYEIEGKDGEIYHLILREVQREASDTE